MKEKVTSKKGGKFSFAELWKNKRSRSIIVSAGVILVCAVIYIVLLMTILKPADEKQKVYPTVGNHGEQMSKDKPFVMNPVEVDKMTGIKVENEFGGFHYYKGADGQFYFENAEAMFYDQTSDWMKGEEQDLSNLTESTSMVESLVSLSRYMLSAGEVVGYDKNNLQIYGLDNGGKASLTLTYLNDKGETESQTVLFGNPTITGNAYYVMLEGRDALYTMQDIYISRCVFTDLKSYILPQVAPPVSSTAYVDVQELVIKKKGETFAALRDLTDEEYEQSGELFTHVFTSPEGYYPSTDNLQLLLEHFISFSGESVVEFDITKRLQDPSQSEEVYKLFRQYSLLDSENRWVYELYYRYADFDVNLYISEKLEVAAEEGSTEDPEYVYYIYSPDFDLIAEFDASELKWVEWDILKLMDNHSFSVSIDRVASVEISYGDTNAKFTLQGTGKELKITSSNGVAVDTDNFRQLYKAILFITMDGTDEKPEDAESILKVRIVLRDGKEFNFEFFGMTARKAFYTLNGSGEFYINRDYVKQIITACTGILKGETITVDRKK
ncbi:MAG: DUF4340 domain-containing protein [Ruminococcaceae bacterium]|nr:DUF4340 domain-containing protein [Oscillospiraceae bacterium]